MNERLMEKIEVGDCWHWTAATNHKGYGRVFWEGRNALAHRVVYEELVGELDPELTLDHLCMNTACVNPDHLEQVTRLENKRRGEARFGGRCPRCAGEFSRQARQRVCNHCRRAAYARGER